MEDENPTEDSPDIGIAATNADPSHDLTEQIDTCQHRSREQKKSQIEKNSDSPSLFQQKVLKVLDKSHNEDDDEDKHFLLSFLPGMKAIDNSSKMDARIEFMQAILSYCNLKCVFILLLKKIKNNIPCNN
ncbi:unnamed protein product [Macrosiphum euphorbiae]|uniref:BESS domain-containing protein n=1 Tax=Macrosiphum euphorbiae TaxID=13131 RepID=A0AAV0XXZ2_9HEMI|nr:unnamed protein product [Macrosiphum euphorbiae]